jgi:adenosylcobinamide-GDP ribazoletransferase
VTAEGRGVVRAARAAFAFLTRLPVGGHPYTAREWSSSVGYFPLVGAALGVGLAAAFAALRPLGDRAAALFTLSLSMALTGALHEDGLADTFDALGGATDRDRMVEILKDSRVGTFGACALVVSIAGRAALLERLGPRALWAIPLVACVARTGPVWLLWRLPYASRPAVAKSAIFADVARPQVTLATVTSIVIAGVTVALRLTSPLRVAALLGAVAVAVTSTAGIYRQRLGGVTGDFLGATEQVSELAAYAALAWG